MTDMEAKAVRMIQDLWNMYPDELAIIRDKAHNAGMEEEYRREINVRDRAATPVLQQKGYRYCDIPACNCGSWHAPPLEETNEYKRGMEEAAKVMESIPENQPEVFIRCAQASATNGLESLLAEGAAAIREKIKGEKDPS